MTTIDLKQSPYFDDYTEGKKFYQILFRPGRAVQARELNQIQSQIKSQIDKFGKHIFKNGTQVSPGHAEGVKVDNGVGFIKIPADSSIFTDTEQNLQTYWLNKKIISISGESGITANVIGYKVADSLNEVRLFVNYISAGTTTGTSSKFSNGQNIQTVETSPLTATISINDYSTGIVQAVRVEEGVYFYNGRFILVDAQTVFVEPTENLIDTPEAWDAYRSAKIGLQFVESVVQWTQDESLLDNATGTPNIGAPGADRLYIDATLKQLDLNSDEESFVELVKIVDGNVRKKLVSTEYSDLDDYLAERTYDESGDYTVIPFQIQIKEFLRTAEQDGVHVEEEFQFDTIDLARLSSVLVFGLATPGQAFQKDGKWMPGSSYDDVNDSTSFTNMVNERLSIIIDPGRAYVKGYRIEKASTSIVDFKKARTTKFRNNKFVETPLGTYVSVKNVNGVLSTDSYDNVILNDDLSSGSPVGIGTARALTIEYFSGFYDASSTVDNREYRLFLFDIKLNDGQNFSNVRSVSSTNPTFNCDVVLDSFRLTGSVSRDSVDSNVINGTGTSWRNDEVDRLSAGDLIEVNAGNDNSKIYEVASNPENDNELVIVGSHSGDTWPDNSKIDYLYAVLRTNSTNSGLVYKTSDTYLKTIRSADSTGAVDPNSIDTVYTVRRINTGETATNNIISLNAGTDQEFESFSFNSYSVVRESDGQWLQVLPYSLGTPSARTCEIRPLGSSLEVYLNAADSATGAFTVYSSVVKPGGNVSKERAKVLNVGSFDPNSGAYLGAGYAVSAGSDVSEISLGRADVLRITRIVEGPEGYSTEPSDNKTLPSGHKDITGLYILDDGQRDYYYDIAKVKLRSGSQRPRGKVRVEFDYFTHNSTTGDYFSVDSYPFSGSSPSMDYSDIPDFTSSDGTLYSLSDCFDFRPIVNSGGIDAGFATIMAVPKDDIRTDYHFYLPRRDKLFLDKTGQFFVKPGNPDENPFFPDDPDSGMTIYELSVAPYTISEKAVFPVMRDNKRYTMRDIGKIEKRVSNIEYYTSLSMLEKDTNSLVIPDALGNDRFKNGFLVDNFKTFNASDLGSADFRCSLDRREGILRPLVQEDAVSLFERALMESVPESFRASKNYQKTGQLYTLPYTPVTMIEQIKASKSINVNPYAVFSYVGAVSITPWTDEWRETSYAEPLNVQDQGAWEATRQEYGPSGTKVDYQSTSQLWLSTSTETTKTGNEILEVAGHRVISQLRADGFFKNKRDKALFKKGYVRVPEGYANAGKIIPIGRNSWVSNETRTTITQNGKEITTDFTSTFVDMGFSAPISMGTRIIDTSVIEFIRSKEVSFTGKAFKPNTRLYPFFDGVDVSAHCTPEGGNLGDPLICDSKGRIEGTFKIPNTDELRFKTGDRIFRLTTSSANILIPAPDSAGDARYTARGWIDTKQETTYSTRMFKIDRDKVESEKDISMVTSEVLGSDAPCPRDPIAQSFFVYEKGGCFITSVDVFFRTRPTGTDQAPLIFQIRELGDQGLPSDRILPFGEIIKEAVEIITNEVNINTGEITVNGNPNTDPKAPATNHTSGPWTNGEYDANGEVESGVSILYENAPTTYMVPTRFTFESPIYLAENKSYCFVLMADSLDYNVWTAQAGPDIDIADPEERIVNVEIGTTIPIETDPYFQGVLFKSQNGLTWTPDQTSDVKFKIWKADFDTSVNGEVDFVNDELPLRLLTLDPLEFSNGSSYIRIQHPNHGHTTARVSPASGNASKVVFSPEYDSQLSGEVISSGVTVTTNGDFNDGSIVAGSFILNPHNGEQKRVVSIDSDTQLTIASAFDSQNELDGDTNILATSYVVPSGASLAGIDAEVLYDYSGHDVEYTELDYYRVNLGTNATASGRFGGNRIFVTENKRFEEMTLITTPLEIPETQISWNVRATSGAGVHNSTNSTYIQQPRASFLCNEKLVFQNPMLVGSYVNELPVPQGPSTGNTAADRKSLAVRAVLSSTNRNISPVLDESRMTAYLISHRMDNPHGIAEEGVDSASIINAEFDNYQVLTTTNTPAVSDTANKLYFVRSTDSISGVSGTAGSRILTASSGFLANIRVGDTVKTDQGDERVVESVIDDTELLLDLELSSTMTAGTLYINPQNTKIKSADASVAQHLSTLDVGKYLTVSGTDNTGARDFTDSKIVRVAYTPNSTVDDGDLSAALIALGLINPGDIAPKLIEIEVEHKNLVASGLDSSASIIVTQKDRFIDEISPNAGSVGAKYVSKTLTVTRPSNALKIMFDASRDVTCELELYYKLQLENSTDNLDDVNWKKAEFNIDENGALIPLTPAPNLSVGSFSEYSSTLTGLPSFVAAQTKIVMRGGNPARSPRIINFRMIVLDE